jgi:hypothetical protein
MTHDERIKFLDKKIAEIAEHCDSVVVLTSWLKPDGNTSSLFRGCGNYFTRTGMVREFLILDNAVTNANEIGKEVNGPDSGEDWKQPT